MHSSGGKTVHAPSDRQQARAGQVAVAHEVLTPCGTPPRSKHRGRSRSMQPYQEQQASMSPPDSASGRSGPAAATLFEARKMSATPVNVRTCFTVLPSIRTAGYDADLSQSLSCIRSVQAGDIGRSTGSMMTPVVPPSVGLHEHNRIVPFAPLQDVCPCAARQGCIPQRAAFEAGGMGKRQLARGGF